MRKYKICVVRGHHCFSGPVDARQNMKLYGKWVGRVATYLCGTDVDIRSSASGHIQRVVQHVQRLVLPTSFRFKITHPFSWGGYGGG